MQRCVVHLPRAATNPILPEHESCTGPSRLPGALQFRATQRDFGLNQGLIVEAEAAPPVRRDFLWGDGRSSSEESALRWLETSRPPGPFSNGSGSRA